MNKTILLAPNSFKECADSITISGLLGNELKTISDINLIEKPLSDGGDGFLSVCERLFSGRRINYSISNIYDKNLVQASIVYNENSKTAYIESAEIVGLKKVPREFRNPLNLNTKALGELLRKISIDVLDHKLNIEKVLIGIGGTATVDFGLGVASILGLKLFDENRNIIDLKPSNYYKAKDLEIPDIRLPFTLQVISDVDTPLFGENNSIRIYSGQKGANQKDIQLLVNGFDNIYNILINNKLIDFSKPINGAGGGLAAGLNLFFGAEIITSTEFINIQILNDIKPRQIDAVVTGEGAFDEQSLENKGAFIIIQKFKELKIPIFLICGTIDASVIHRLPSNVHLIELRKYFTSVEESIKNYVVGLKKAAVEIINHIKN